MRLTILKDVANDRGWARRIPVPVSASMVCDLCPRPARYGRAGRSMVEETVSPIADEQFWFNQFRLGPWPDYYDGVQFDRNPETLNQYFRAWCSIPSRSIWAWCRPQSRLCSIALDPASDTFAERWSGLADSHPQRQGKHDRVVRTWQQLRLCQRRGAAAYAELVGHARSAGGANLMRSVR